MVILPSQRDAYKEHDMSNQRQERSYRVVWTIDIEAGSHGEAASKALNIQRNPESLATVFDVSLPMGGPVVDTRRIDLLADMKDEE